MKKFFAILLVLAMICALCACGRAPADDTAAPSAGVTAGGNTVLAFGSGNTTGAYYPVAGGLAQIINDDIANTTCVVEATGGSVENMRRVNNGELQLGLANDYLLYYAAYEDPFGLFAEGEDFSNLRAIATNHASLTSVVVPADSDITSIEQLVGRSVSVGAPGSGNYVTAMNILSAYDITEEDIKARLETFSEGAEALKEGNCDAIILQGGTPVASLIELTSLTDCRFIPIDDEHLDKICEMFPFYYPSAIPAGTYTGQNEDVQTIKTWNTVFCSADFDEELLYSIMEQWYAEDKLEYLYTVHTSLKDMNLKEAPNVTITLHPAAEQFYKDKGIA